MATSITPTPTWGEIGNSVYRLAISNETEALEVLRPGMARAFAMAEALHQLMNTLTDAQCDIVSKVLAAELTLQGY